MAAVIHHPDYHADLPDGHRFPMGKYRRLGELLVEEGLDGGGFIRPAPAAAGLLALAHDRAYVDRVLAAAVPPEIAREIGFPVSEQVARRAAAATGGTVLAARLALSEGLALNTAGGSHHARRAHGAGFCTFNDVAVAALAMRAEGAARRILVLDLDVHQGDGTADILGGEEGIVTVSVHAEKNYPVRKVPSTLDAGLDDGTGDAAYLETVERLIGVALDIARPDLVFYNAGVDPHADDRLGRLSLSDRGLLARERLVLGRLSAAGVPVAVVIGGGYDSDLDRLARRHALVFAAAQGFDAVDFSSRVTSQTGTTTAAPSRK